MDLFVLLLCGEMTLHPSWCILDGMQFAAKSIGGEDRVKKCFFTVVLTTLFTSPCDSLNWMFWLPEVPSFAAVTITGFSLKFRFLNKQ